MSKVNTWEFRVVVDTQTNTHQICEVYYISDVDVLVGSPLIISDSLEFLKEKYDMMAEAFNMAPLDHKNSNEIEESCKTDHLYGEFKDDGC